LLIVQSWSEAYYTAVFVPLSLNLFGDEEVREEGLSGVILHITSGGEEVPEVPRIIHLLI